MKDEFESCLEDGFESCAEGESESYIEEGFESYGDFAYIYDKFMDTTPYEEWCASIIEIIERYGISRPGRNSEDPLEAERNLVLDLGCGTGTLCEMLYAKGYDMIGVDLSESMLAVAMEKREQSGSEILYLNQDMRELDMYCTIGTVFSVCDSVNYVLEEDELLQTFKLVNNFLYPGGLFIFDFNTVHKYRDVIGDSVIAENREDCSFIWENYYDPEEELNEYDMTFFVKEEGDLFRRFSEVHVQRGYTIDQIRRLVLEAGMELVEMRDSDTGAAPTEDSERVLVIAREHGKTSQ